jgi:hypothetical protein
MERITTRIGRGFVLALAVTALAGCHRGNGTAEATTSSGDPAGTRDAPARSQGGNPRTEMKNVQLQAMPGVILEIRSLRGELEPIHEGDVPFFDDPSTFEIHIDSAEIAASPQSLERLMNDVTFNYPKAPLKDLHITIEDGKVRQSGRLEKKIPVHFETLSEVSVTPEGKIRLHPVQIKAGGVGVKKLLDLLDIEMSEVIKTEESRGVALDGDDILLDPERLVPPPRIRGRLTAVRIEGDRIVQVFGGKGKGKDLAPPDPDAKNYMYYKGGNLRFGKLTMDGADLQIVDADPGDPFYFYLKEYKKQLVAGYSRNTPSLGLIVRMPDYDEAGSPLKGP